MTVKKKVLRVTAGDGSIDLTSRLQHVREAISQLPPEEQPMSETPSTETAETNKGPRKVVKKAAKKVVKKAATKKPASNGAAKAEAGTTLATIAKSLKMEPRKARRILRGAEGVPEAGARWTWTKAADVAKVKSILEKAEEKKSD